MGRLTRAKAAEMHIHEDAAPDVTFLDCANDVDIMTETRTPLAEIEHNSSSNAMDAGTTMSEVKKPTQSRKSSKKRGKRNDNTIKGQDIDPEAAPSTATSGNSVADDTVQIQPDDIDSATSPASQAASEDLMKTKPELGQSHLPVHDIRPRSPPSAAVRLTRSQLKESPEAFKRADFPTTVKNAVELLKVDEETSPVDTFAGGSAIPETKDVEIATTTGEVALLERTQARRPDAMPNTLQSAGGEAPIEIYTSTRNRDYPDLKQLSESMTSANSQPDATSTYDQLEAAAIQAQTPPKSSRMSTIDDSITALDEMDDAVDKVNAEMPNIQASPQKTKTKKAPIVRTTKASQARISLAHGPRDAQRRTSSWGKPPAMSNSQRVTSASSNKSNEGASERKEVQIPHSKPRPISMSFPTPPPPPKSSKAPTTSTFQLPGEAVAAKLKAAKEARLLKEAEEQKKKSFKARPAPSMTKPPTVRQTSTSKARESMMNGRAPTAEGLKRANSVATTRPSFGARPNTGTKPAVVRTAALNRLSIAPAIARTAALNRLSIAPATAVRINKRPSTAMASLTKPRPLSVAAKPAAQAPRPASSIGGPGLSRGNGAGTSKGREVFNRAAQAKSAAEKEKREKEEAAKKARAAAAEMGRQRSREWAEKQRMKKLGVTATTTTKNAEVKTKENVEPAAETENVQSVEEPAAPTAVDV